jgi:hypothetical protein
MVNPLITIEGYERRDDGRRSEALGFVPAVFSWVVGGGCSFSCSRVFLPHHVGVGGNCYVTTTKERHHPGMDYGFSF